MLFATVFHRYTPAFSARILGIYIYSWFASRAVEYGVKAFCIQIYKYAIERIIGNNITKNQILLELQKFFEFKFHSHEIIHVLYSSKIFQIISPHFFSCFLSNRIIKPNHRKRIQLTIQYNSQIHNKTWTIITKLQNHIQKLKNISCRRNWLNFIRFLAIQLHNAENQRIKYIHKQTSNTVLNIVIMCPNQIGSHLILLCINQNIQAHVTKNIIKFFMLTFELINKYQIGIRLHNKAEIKTHRFCHEDNI